jgi:hypothetical protein
LDFCFENISSGNPAQVWENVSNLEDSECVRRFLCEVATKAFDAPEYEGLADSIVDSEQVCSKPIVRLSNLQLQRQRCR